MPRIGREVLQEDIASDAPSQPNKALMLHRDCELRDEPVEPYILQRCCAKQGVRGREEVLKPSYRWQDDVMVVQLIPKRFQTNTLRGATPETCKLALKF